ncbi:hypothetical protein N431DRAFT_396252 [Stipitochalara longipes BDJ]|nr:hypothetical protein N431DRAFT_396252 [Stipitochalara longipes BDJ]
MRRELIGKEEGASIPALPLLAVRGHLCFRCLSHSAKLSKCGGCKRAMYCGKSCQTLDWKIQHKNHCKILQVVNEAEAQEEAESRSCAEWKRLLVSQPYCRTCHRGVLEIRPPTTLNPCPVCHLVFTSSSCTSSHQLQECKLFETIGNVETFAISHFELCREGEVRGVETSSPKSSYRPISTINSWHEYFTRITNYERALSGIVNSDFGLNQTFLQSLQDEKERVKTKAWYYFLFMGTARLSMPISILAALKKSTHDLSTRQSLSISLIGAGEMEIAGLWVFEELLHLLPALQTLNLIFVGPANKMLPSISSDGKGDVIECKNCAECVFSNMRRFWDAYGGLYHDYVNTSYYQKPDLAVIFHSGRAESAINEWAPTTRFLVDSSTPTLCTSWTEREAREEEIELDQLGARFITRPEKNKWRSLVPIVDFLEGADDEVYYVNYYQYMFQGKLGPV